MCYSSSKTSTLPSLDLMSTKTQKMSGIHIFMVMVGLVLIAQASNLPPMEVCKSCCNTTLAIQHIGYDKCMNDCPDCERLRGPDPGRNATPECQNRCLHSKEPVDEILCRDNCADLWCATHTNAYQDPSPRPVKEDYGFATWKIVSIVMGSLVVIIALSVTVFFLKRHGENPKNTAVPVEQDPQGRPVYCSLPLDRVESPVDTSEPSESNNEELIQRPVNCIYVG